MSWYAPMRGMVYIELVGISGRTVWQKRYWHQNPGFLTVSVNGEWQGIANGLWYIRFRQKGLTQIFLWLWCDEVYDELR